MNRRRLSFTFAAGFFLLLSAASAAINPAIVTVASVSGAGPMAWDGDDGVMWVGSGSSVIALNASGTIVATVPVQTSVSIAYDPYQGNLWGVSHGNSTVWAFHAANGLNGTAA